MSTLTSRTLMRPLRSLRPRPRSCVPASAVSRAALSSVVSLKFPPPALREGPCLRGRLHDLLLLGVTLEARLCFEVAVHGVRSDEDEARVGLRGPRDTARDLVQIELHNREEALQIGLLVDGEVYVARLHELEYLGEEIVATSPYALVVQPELLHDLGDTLRASGVHGKHPGYVLMAVVPGFDPGQLIGELCARRHLLNLDVRTGVLYGLLGAVDPRLNVELPGRRYKERHEPLVDETDDPLSHLDTGLEQVLPHISERGVRPRSFAVGIVGDNGDVVVQGLLDRLVESHGINHRDGDASSVARDGGVQRVDHLRDYRFLRARPLRRRPKSACASSMPYLVGMKKGLVVTWLIKTKFHSGVSGKSPPDP